jgi:hypothetical protein
MRSDDMEVDDASQSRLAPHGGKVPGPHRRLKILYQVTVRSVVAGTRRNFGRGLASSSCLEAVPLVPCFLAWRRPMSPMQR